MTTPDFILTHPGSAHKDEFLACAVLLSLYPVTIERREPVEKDLSDSSICVIDVGHLHDPSLNNFDHHQLPKDHPPTCSLSLILQYLGIYGDAKEFLEWLEPAEWFDCRGPVSTAKWLGVERALLNKLNSPIDVTLLRRFSLSAKHSPGEPLWEVMRMIGADIVDYVKTLRARLDFIEGHAEIWSLGQNEKVKVLFLPRTDPMPEEPSMGMDQYIESKSLESEVVGLVYPDRRGSGYGLSRFRDNPSFDFTRLEGSEGVHFVHARGFVAKTSLNKVFELKALLTKSLV